MIFFFFSLLLFNSLHAFFFENPLENVTYVHSLSDSAKKDNEFFEQDSMNEVSYSITRPVDFVEGKMFFRPTFIKEIIPPKATNIIRRNNLKTSIYIQEEIPYFYDAFPVLKNDLNENKTKENQSIVKEIFIKENVQENNSIIKENYDSFAGARKEKKIKNISSHRKKNKNNINRKIDLLFNEIHDLVKKTGFLNKAVRSLKAENHFLKGKFNKKEAKSQKKHLLTHKTRKIRRPNQMKSRKTSKKGKRKFSFHSFHKKKKQPINSLLKKFKNLNKMKKFFQKK